jgi:quaternary ammonium compound-resistance protein SugE
MAWGLLLTASVVEIGWAIGLKYTEGFTRLVPSILVAMGIVISFILVARAARDIPIGTAYGVFVGIGTGGTGLLGMLLFGESANLPRLLSLVAIILGVVGLKLFGDDVSTS